MSGGKVVKQMVALAAVVEDHQNHIFLVVKLLANFAAFLWFGKIFLQLRSDYWRMRNHRFKHRMTLKAYLKYRFEFWCVSASNSNAVIICFVSGATLLVGADLHVLTTENTFYDGYAKSTFASFLWLVAPDGGGSAETLAEKALGAVMSLAGVVIFALLITLLQDGFASWIESQKSGDAAVMESGHILLIGLSTETIPVVTELINFNESSEGAVIVVLAIDTGADAKKKMEDDIKDVVGDAGLRNSRIVVRAGDPHDDDALALVSADTAKTIAILPDMNDPCELRDASVLRTLVAIRGKGWPLKGPEKEGRVVVAASLLLNEPIFRATGGENTDIVMLNSFEAMLMVQSSRQWGLGRVIDQTIGFDDVRFVLQPMPPQLVGKTMLKAAFYFPSAVVVGVGQFPGDAPSDGDTCLLCPGADYRLKLEDTLVILAAQHELPALPEPIVYVMPPIRGTLLTPPSVHAVEKILFMGFNQDLIGKMIRQLEKEVAPGTEVVIVSPMPEEDQKTKLHVTKMRLGTVLKNISKVTHVQGMLGSRYMLTEIPLAPSDASRIFVLSDDHRKHVSSATADTCTIALIMQLRDEIIVRRRMEAPFKGDFEHPRDRCMIIPEIRHSDSRTHCSYIKATDFVDTYNMPSQVLGMAIAQPRMLTLFREVLSDTEGRVKFSVRRIDDYLKNPPDILDFFQLLALCQPSGDIVIGWSKEKKQKDIEVSPHGKKKASEVFADRMVKLLREANPASWDVDWELNPEDKTKKRNWDMENDRLVVLSTQLGG